MKSIKNNIEYNICDWQRFLGYSYDPSISNMVYCNIIRKNNINTIIYKNTSMEGISLKFDLPLWSFNYEIN